MDNEEEALLQDSNSLLLSSKPTNLAMPIVESADLIRQIPPNFLRAGIEIQRASQA